MGSSLVTSRANAVFGSSKNAGFQVVPFPNNSHTTSGSVGNPYVLITLDRAPSVIVVHEYYDNTNGGAHFCSFLLYAENGFATEQWIDKTAYVSSRERSQIYFRYHQSTLQVQYYFYNLGNIQYYLDRSKTAFLFIAY